jgi:hypothetical protein
MSSRNGWDPICQQQFLPEGEPLLAWVIGTKLRVLACLRRSIREDEPNSAEWEAEAINLFERSDWSVKLRARSVCKSTPTHFFAQRPSRHGRVIDLSSRAHGTEKLPASLSDAIVIQRENDLQRLTCWHSSVTFARVHAPSRSPI